jgi:hypothetical protein|tara:strand:+ start:160 stop:996 length:837 start_codon:yes stop_codon:yes gene_type:complete
MSQALLTKFRKARQGSSEQKEILRRAKNDIRRAKLLNKKPSAALQTIIKEFKPETKAQLKQKQALAADMGITLAAGPIIGKAVKVGRAGVKAGRAALKGRQKAKQAAEKTQKVAQTANKNKNTKLPVVTPPVPKKLNKLGATLTGAGATAIGAGELLKDSKPGPKRATAAAAKESAPRPKLKKPKKPTTKKQEPPKPVDSGRKAYNKGFETMKEYFVDDMSGRKSRVKTPFGTITIDSSDKGMAFEEYESKYGGQIKGTVKRRMGGKVRGFGKALRGY